MCKSFRSPSPNLYTLCTVLIDLDTRQVMLYEGNPGVGGNAVTMDFNITGGVQQVLFPL